MRHFVVASLCAALVLPAFVSAQEKELSTGDGRKFSLAFDNGLPARAETDHVVWEAAGFSTDTASAEPTVTDNFTFVLKGGDRPVRLLVEDVTGTTPVKLLEVPVPESLPSAGFRRSKLEAIAQACPIAHGEPCSAWMFGEQALRLYAATFTFADGRKETLFQAEPYAMASFIARLGDRVPDHRGATTAGTP